MIYTAPYVMLLMRANPLRGQVGGGWALEINGTSEEYIFTVVVQTLHAVAMYSRVQRF
jgi:hypothetical protein